MAIWAVDFGTTYSEPVVIGENGPELLLPRNKNAIPSLFYYDKRGKILVGENAELAGVGRNAQNLVRDVKMKTGETFTLGDRTFTAEDIIYHIIEFVLGQARQYAEQQDIDCDIDGIAITTPAKFHLPEREVIRAAGNRTGYTVRYMVSEPVAAAIAYFQKDVLNDSVKKGTTVMVYDFGGGTFDTAIVTADNNRRGKFKVVGEPLTCRVGGRDVDAKLQSYILEDIVRQAGEDGGDYELLAELLARQGTEEDPTGYLEDILRSARHAKESLSQTGVEEYDANIRIDRENYYVTLSREILERETRSLIGETLDCMQKLYDANRDDYNITKIICVGGSCNMPHVKAAIQRRFPRCEVQLWNPTLAIAYGTAIFASLPEQPMMKAPFSYGTDTFVDAGTEQERKLVHNHIFCGSDLPASNERGYTPHKDNQRAVRFDLFESEETEEYYEPAEGRKIGSVELELPPHTPKTYSMRLNLQLDRDGRLVADAYGKRDRKKVKASITLQVGKYD